MNPAPSIGLGGAGANRAQVLRSVLPRVPVVAFVLVSAVLCWWTWHRLTPEVQLRGKKIREHQQRLGDVTDLRRRHRVAMEGKVSERHAALVDRFFADQEGVLGWLREDVSGEATSLGLELEPTLSAAAETVVLPGCTNTVFRVRVGIRSRPGAGDGVGIYAGLLKLLDRMVDDERWCVIDAIRVRAQPDGALQAHVELRAMARPNLP